MQYYFYNFYNFRPALSRYIYQVYLIWRDRRVFRRVGVRLCPLIRNVTEAVDFYHNHI